MSSDTGHSSDAGNSGGTGRAGIVLAAVAPHPPIIVPAVGRGEIDKVAKTRESMAQMAELAQAAKPDVIIVISPHAPLFSDAVAVNLAPRLAGDFGQFGAPQVKIDAPNDVDLAEAIATEIEKAGLAAARLDEEASRDYEVDASLYHGTMVPLYFIQEPGPLPPLVSLAMSLFSRAKLYRAGQAIRSAVDRLGRRAVLIASGDLSHRLKPGAPAGFSPAGAEFDQLFSEAVRAADVKAVLEVEDRLREEAGECGYRSIVMMLGAMDGRRLENLVFSYEGPFGVGYCVSLFRPSRETGLPERSFGAWLEGEEGTRRERLRTAESAPVRLARKAVEEFVRTGRRLLATAAPLTESAGVFKQKAGCFVSLHVGGELRGCIGTIQAQHDNVATEIIANAINAASEDPRFPPVGEEELDDIEYSVDILGRPEPISGLGELDPRRYGVIVSKGWRRGLLLPDLPGIDDAAEQVDVARRKAGIAPGEDVTLERFEVVRYH